MTSGNRDDRGAQIKRAPRYKAAMRARMEAKVGWPERTKRPLFTGQPFAQNDVDEEPSPGRIWLPPPTRLLGHSD